MCNRRRRRCCVLNNSNYQDNSEYETMCQNVGNESEDFNTHCGCGFDDEVNDGFPENAMYGQSYVPIQEMENTYMPCSGLHKGTIFPELVSEYCPGQSMAQIQYIKDTNTIKEGCNK